ncbi:DUF6801 domain-containing protein [Nocardia sp. NPDC046473]|uniref:DUF6801 domain-containing protein n=1 Tax=Nocardia sp. NPDC046473 TaxID=3155733 RepID=UPI0033F75895
MIFKSDHLTRLDVPVLRDGVGCAGRCRGTNPAGTESAVPTIVFDELTVREIDLLRSLKEVITMHNRISLAASVFAAVALSTTGLVLGAGPAAATTHIDRTINFDCSLYGQHVPTSVHATGDLPDAVPVNQPVGAITLTATVQLPGAAVAIARQAGAATALAVVETGTSAVIGTHEVNGGPDHLVGSLVALPTTGTSIALSATNTGAGATMDSVGTATVRLLDTTIVTSVAQNADGSQNNEASDQAQCQLSPVGTDTTLGTEQIIAAG